MATDSYKASLHVIEQIHNKYICLKKTNKQKNRQPVSESKKKKESELTMKWKASNWKYNLGFFLFLSILQ